MSGVVLSWQGIGALKLRPTLERCLAYFYTLLILRLASNVNKNSDA